MPTSPPEQAAHLITGGAIGSIATALIVGFWQWLRWRPRGRAQVIAAEATYRDAITRQAEVFTAAMNEMVERQKTEIADLHDDLENLKSDLQNERALRRQDRAYIEALRRELINAGIPIPEEPPPALIVQTEREGVTTFTGLGRRAPPR